MANPDRPYYRHDLALVHHLGFGFHADECAPGILELLRPIREREGLVVELGCGSGLLTRYLVEAGHRVIATDASPAMLDLARGYAVGAQEIRALVLPDDPIPEADAVVSVGHVLSYLPDEGAIDRALVAIAGALRPGGILAIDLCDLTYTETAAFPVNGRVAEDWAILVERSAPAPDRFVRQMAVFTRNEDGGWRRDDERHENVLIDTAAVPSFLAEHGVRAAVESSFGGGVELPRGLHAIIGSKDSG
jgi:SAM-dependent methyltransferase